MAQLGRPGLSPQQKKDLWFRWKQGQSLSEIGRALGKAPGSVHGVLTANGGVAPAARTRARWALTLADREEISRGLVTGLSFRAIATRLRRPPSTISREVARNHGRTRYRAASADVRAWTQTKRPKQCVLAANNELRGIVAQKLKDDWSPQQIAGWLRISFGGDRAMWVSHETIYRSLFIQTRGVLQKALITHLRSKRTMRRGKHFTTAGQERGRIRNAVSIRDRPVAIEARATVGHWEGDLIAGARNTHVATLVERRSRFTVLVQVAGKDSASVIQALVRQVSQLPEELMASLTWDRGMELAEHEAFSARTGVPVYFCDPQSPWQRGSNENTNGLLRQYFPYGTDLSVFTQAKLDVIAQKLNDRPRKALGYSTPSMQFVRTVAVTD